MTRRTLVLALVLSSVACKSRDDGKPSGTPPTDASVPLEAAAPYLPARSAQNADPAAPLTVVESVLLAQRSDLSFCYRTAAKVNPKLEGEAVLGVTIGGDGKVTEVVTVSKAGLDDALMQCLTDVMKRATFPPPADGGVASVKVPLSFHPPRNADAGR